MKYWIDTEFVERPYTIDLISIGLVAEDGREFYAESSEVDWAKASQWTLQTVRPQLDGRGMPREDIGYAVRRFLDADKQPVFWGYFPAYDWVVFSWLFGNMDELPFTFRNSVLMSNNGRLGLATRSYRNNWALATMLSPTHGGHGTHGRFSPALIQSPANDVAPAKKT